MGTGIENGILGVNKSNQLNVYLDSFIEGFSNKIDKLSATDKANEIVDALESLEKMDGGKQSIEEPAENLHMQKIGLSKLLETVLNSDPKACSRLYKQWGMAYVAKELAAGRDRKDLKFSFLGNTKAAHLEHDLLTAIEGIKANDEGHGGPITNMENEFLANF
jgi:hypothetical protein